MLWMLIPGFTETSAVFERNMHVKCAAFRQSKKISSVNNREISNYQINVNVKNKLHAKIKCVLTKSQLNRTHSLNINE